MRIIIPMVVLILALMSCKTKQQTKTSTAATTTTVPKENMHGAHAIVYKTKADYSQYVPVTLTDDGSAISSYPAPSDIYYRGVLAKPTKLADGYLLDNRGVNAHSAFIKMTYEDYAKLTEVPSLKTLYGMIMDKAPFTEMYDIGVRSTYTDEVTSINALIKGGRLQEYKKLM